MLWRTDYEATLQKITDYNTRLRTLVTDWQGRESASRGRRAHRSSLTSLRGIRKYMRSLRNTLRSDDRWQCSEPHSHFLSLRLDDEKGAFTEDGSSATSKFALILWLRDHSSSSQSHAQWFVRRFHMQVITAESANIPQNTSHVPSLDYIPSQKFALKSILKPVNRVHKDIMKAVVMAPSQAIPSMNQYSYKSMSPELTNICSHLCNRLPSVDLSNPFKCLGSVKDINDSTHFYELYVTQNLSETVQPETLHGVLASDLARTPLSQVGPDSLYIWKNRLRVAVILAMSVLQLQGSWMDQQWGTKDIVLANDTTNTASISGESSKLPYLDCKIPASPHALSQPDPIIQSQVLFPLGLALTELACLQPIDKLRLPEDDRHNPSTTDLVTASRLLNIVRGHCGPNYAEAVRICLFWPGPGGEDMNDEEFQSAVYDKVVQPLKEDLASWFSH